MGTTTRESAMGGSRSQQQQSPTRIHQTGWEIGNKIVVCAAASVLRLQICISNSDLSLLDLSICMFRSLKAVCFEPCRVDM